MSEYPQIHNQIKNSLTKEGMEILCQRVCEEPKIRFCGVINSLGRIVTGGFKEGIKPIDNESLRQMLYIPSTLELSMKGEFDNVLGVVNYVITYRDNVAIITIPMLQNDLLLLSVEKNADIEKIVNKTSNLFECNGIFNNKHKPKTSDDNPLIFTECA